MPPTLKMEYLLGIYRMTTSKRQKTDRCLFVKSWSAPWRVFSLHTTHLKPTTHLKKWLILTWKYGTNRIQVTAVLHEDVFAFSHLIVSADRFLICWAQKRNHGKYKLAGSHNSRHRQHILLAKAAKFLKVWLQIIT